MQVIPAVRRVPLQASLVFMETIHQNLRRLREAQGLSLEAVAKELDIEWQSVQQWEGAGNKAPTFPRRKRLKQLAALYNVSEAELISADTKPPNGEVDRDDPLYEKLFRQFFWLTQKQKEDVVLEITSMAEGNKAITRQLRTKLDPAPDAAVRKAYKRHPRDLQRKSGSK
jgi:transcriptional regulator with XRE-family HTH domain